MKFLRFLCNFLLFFVYLIGVSLVQIGVYDLSAAQSEDVDGIHILAPNDSSIAYFDSYTFWADDIKENIKQPAKYRVRNWVGADWWKNGMGWLDKGIDVVIGVVKPIVVPIAQINAVKNYYGRDIKYFEEVLVKYSYGESEEAYNNALYEVYVIYDMGYGNATTAGINSIPIEDYQYTGNLAENSSAEYARWVRDNKTMYNHIWKLNKYNSPTYTKYFNKFITEKDGVRGIKTASIVLYYQGIVSFVVALFFICKFPINFVQGKYTGKDMKD